MLLYLCGDTYFKVNQSIILSKYHVLCANSRRDNGKKILSKSVFAIQIGFTGIGAVGPACSRIYLGCIFAEASATCKAERKDGADCRQTEAQRNSTPWSFVFLTNANLSFWLAIAYLFKSTESLLLAPEVWNSTGFSLLYYWIQKPMTARQGARKCICLLVVVVSGGFVARGNLCYWVWKMNRNFTQAGFFSPCDAFKNKSICLLTLLRKQHKPHNNDHTFSCHFCLNALSVEICALWGIQNSASGWKLFFKS